MSNTPLKLILVINSSSFGSIVIILIEEGNFYTLDQLNNLWIELYE